MTRVDIVAAEARIFAEELAAATPFLAGRNVCERLVIARVVECIVRLRCGVEPLNPVPAIPTT